MDTLNLMPRLQNQIRSMAVFDNPEFYKNKRLEDVREKGRPIRVSIKGDLRIQQSLVADRLLAYDHGVLSAATAFGKTVVCSYLISARKVNTLILLHNKDLIEQWVEELDRFLEIDEEPPIYKILASI